MLRHLTSGESHGRELTAIVEGLPSGLKVATADIDRDLARRQRGYGRGGRMLIEKDCVEITSGIRHGLTMGSPVGLVVKNRDWENWTRVMSVAARDAGSAAERSVSRPRPGHADLTGGLKYGHRDLRNILERSSARETAARVAVGALARRLLDEFGVSVMSWVREIGGVSVDDSALAGDPARLAKLAEKSDVACPEPKTAERMRARIDKAKADGDSLGGIFTIVATGVPPGLGSYVQWDRKLDGRLAGALMSVQATKGVEVGVGFRAGTIPGSEVHDEIFYRDKGKSVKRAKGDFWPQEPRFYRKTNRAGGIEGGMSNGEPVVLHAVMKPIPTLYKPLKSVDIETKKRFIASVERSDVCAVPAAAVVAEAVVAYELAGAFLDKFGGDTVTEIERNYRGYLKEIAGY